MAALPQTSLHHGGTEESRWILRATCCRLRTVCLLVICHSSLPLKPADTPRYRLPVRTDSPPFAPKWFPDTSFTPARGAIADIREHKCASPPFPHEEQAGKRYKGKGT